MLVGEFQDLNEAQYAILQRLVVRHSNFFAVGDDEQSIFSWTGADPMLLKRFSRDYDPQTVLLEENMRCSRQIFEAARRLVANKSWDVRWEVDPDRAAFFAWHEPTASLERISVDEYLARHPELAVSAAVRPKHRVVRSTPIQGVIAVWASARTKVRGSL